MFTSKKILIAIVAIFILSLFFINQKNPHIPLVSIANYGPHPSLQETIDGIKSELEKMGYIEGKNIRYEITDVNFDTSLIIQMLTKLKASKPTVLVAISTPIAQVAKNLIKSIPVVFTDVTDPESAGLVTTDENNNITGVSDQQNLSFMLDFALKLLPNAKTVGTLYSSGEANDFAMVEMLKKVAAKAGLQVIAIPIEHSRDTNTRIQSFKGEVDFIYTGSSGVVQSALPMIISRAESMKLPHFNFNSEEVKTNNALASYGVSHFQVGVNTAIIIHRILNGENPSDIPIIHPKVSDHTGFISVKRANKIKLHIPENLTNITIIE